MSDLALLGVESCDLIDKGLRRPPSNEGVERFEPRVEVRVAVADFHYSASTNRRSAHSFSSRSPVAPPGVSFSPQATSRSTSPS